jgi:hypothetical protein
VTALDVPSFLHCFLIFPRSEIPKYFYSFRPAYRRSNQKKVSFEVRSINNLPLDNSAVPATHRCWWIRQRPRQCRSGRLMAIKAMKSRCSTRFCGLVALRNEVSCLYQSKSALQRGSLISSLSGSLLMQTSLGESWCS